MTEVYGNFKEHLNMAWARFPTEKLITNNKAYSNFGDLFLVWLADLAEYGDVDMNEVSHKTMVNSKY